MPLTLFTARVLKEECDQKTNSKRLPIFLWQVGRKCAKF